MIVIVGFYIYCRCFNIDIVDSCWYGYVIWIVVVVRRGLMYMVGSIFVIVVIRMSIIVGI